jgi:hypothetical protein
VALPLADGAVQAVLQRAAGAQARRGGNGAGPGSAAGTPRQAGHDAEHGRGAPAPDAADDWNEAFAQLVACSPAMRAVVELAGRVAATDAAVLIQGETGTGKALLAYQIHRRSRRAGGPFVRVACGALRENEADEMLFGRPATPFVPQGAPAGAAGNGGGHPMSETPPGPLGQMRSPACPPASSAASAPPGLLASARGGTLYLQNVERLPFSTQVKLCDALQGGDYDWPSMPDAGRADVRVVASTRQDLKAAVAENRFYSGLYYLLDVMPIAVRSASGARTSGGWPSTSWPRSAGRGVWATRRRSSTNRRGSACWNPLGPATPGSWPASSPAPSYAAAAARSPGSA